MVIRQGEIYWVNLREPSGSEPGYRHPHVVIQNNLFNQSRINTVVRVDHIKPQKGQGAGECSPQQGRG